MAVFLWIITGVACGTAPGAKSVLVGTWEMRLGTGERGARSPEQKLDPKREQIREVLRNALTDPSLELPQLTFFQDGSGEIEGSMLGHADSDRINWRLVINDVDRIVIMTSRPAHEEETEWEFAVESPDTLRSVGGKLHGIRWQRRE
jgi:hypothetical protein